MRTRWTGLAATVALIASLLSLNGAFEGVRAATPTAPTYTLFAAGDIARCDGADDEATAAIVAQGVAADPDHTKVAMLGDGAYPDGSLASYQNCYGPSWGPFLDRTLPVPGNHDYGQNMTDSNAGYRSYFDSVLGPLNASGNTLADNGGWWSYDLGAWHIIGLNWDCDGPGATGCGEKDPQGQWLAADLAKAQSKCLIAMWHGARFFSQDQGEGRIAGPSSDTAKTSTYWRMIQAAGGDVVLAGHQHLYERFDRMSVVEPADAPSGDHQGQVDPNGMRQFVVGTGGGKPATFTTLPPAVGSQARSDNSSGVLKLALHDTGYDWQFISAGTGSATAPAAGTVIDSGSDSCGGGLTPPPTTAPTSGITSVPTPRVTASRNGYWMVGADGKVYGFGTAQSFGDPTMTPGSPAVDLEPTPTGDGYWVVDSAGGVASLGDAVYRGAPAKGTLAAGEQVTSLSATPTGLGYWMFTNRGRALTFGDAQFLGDMSKVTLNGPVLDSIPTPSGHGYFMVASDGGIFAFGDATFYGSMGGKHLNAPIQSLVPDGDGAGYWLVASDGGIFAFQAPFRGSMGSAKLNKPVTGMVRFADGYLMVSEDGGIFDFSSQPFLGSLGDHPPAHPVVSVAALG